MACVTVVGEGGAYTRSEVSLTLDFFHKRHNQAHPCMYLIGRQYDPALLPICQVELEPSGVLLLGAGLLDKLLVRVVVFFLFIHSLSRGGGVHGLPTSK